MRACDVGVWGGVKGWAEWLWGRWLLAADVQAGAGMETDWGEDEAGWRLHAGTSLIAG